MSRLLLFFISTLLYFTSTSLALFPTEVPLSRGFVKSVFSSKEHHADIKLSREEKASHIAKFCQKLQIKFKEFTWKESPCGGLPWRADLKSPKGNPLVYLVFGKGRQTTLIFGGVHPDEVTPVHLSFRFARHLYHNPEIYEGKGLKVVVAPLVNPDGFIKKRVTRVNSRGIDVNRNFFTLDWYEKSLGSWRRRGNRARYFPGFFPNTEVETIFQVEMIDTYKPSKILSIHAPLGFYDYDGPGDQVFLKGPRYKNVHKAKILLYKVAEKSRNYKVVDYSFYPGSLGNFAGNERGIPTLTLELETTNPRNVNNYWDKFLPGFIQSVEFNYTQKSF